MRIARRLPGVQRSTGCSEPGAIALAAAIAARAAGGDVHSVRVACDINTLKNATGAGIPGGMGARGAELAAALGAVAGDPTRSLQALAAMTPTDLATARRLVEGGSVAVEQRREPGPARIWIEVEVLTSAGAGLARIENDHTRVTRVEVDGAAHSPPTAREIVDEKHLNWPELSLSEVLDLALDIDGEDEAFLLDSARINMAAALVGLGKELPPGLEAGLASETLALAASKHRMEGALTPVVTSGFSGNQGLVASIPVWILARELGVGDRELALGLATSHLVGQYVRHFTGVLSPICNAVHAASVGAAAGCVRLMGGGAEEVGRVSDLVLASVAGTLCDGAKPGCALKVGLGAGRAIRCAQLAMQGLGLTVRDGIVADSPEGTIRRVGRLAHPLLESVDQELAQMVLEKPAKD